MNQAELTTNLNFDYYLISSAREQEVFSPEPAYLSPGVYRRMVDSARTLSGLVGRLTAEYLKGQNGHPDWLVPDFPHRRRILELAVDLPPFFWARYDAFERADGGIFFSEFNYDKPCAQREILVSAAFAPDGNPNSGFAESFRSGVVQLWREWGGSSAAPKVGVMVDPNHYEETHLGYLYADLLKPLGWNTRVVGAENIRVKKGRVLAYGEPLDIVLRQFPTEFSHEIPDYAKLLQVYTDRGVLILNDPRAIVPQAKSLFAYLWQLTETGSEFLTAEERKVIADTLPYTRMFSPVDVPELLANRDKWVVKAVYGRYSEEVYIGTMLNHQEWEAVLAGVAGSGAAHIIQEFVPIKKQAVSRFAAGRYEDTLAHGNYGVYFTNGEYTGLCVRWSADYLTADDTVWFSPVGVKEPACPYFLKNPGWSEEKRREVWRDTANTAAFEYGYPSSFTGEYESFCLETLVLRRSAYSELIEAAEKMTRVFERAVTLVKSLPAKPIYYVTGNHDWWTNLEVKQPLESLGVKWLANQSVKLTKDGQHLWLLGVDDPYLKKARLDLALGEVGDTAPKILLAHAPNIYEPAARAGVNLLLVGHTHAGQVRLPLIGAVIVPGQGFFPKLDYGRFTTGDTTMIISSGLGESELPIRFYCPPEIVLITLQPAD